MDRSHRTSPQISQLDFLKKKRPRAVALQKLKSFNGYIRLAPPRNYQIPTIKPQAKIYFNIGMYRPGFWITDYLNFLEDRILNFLIFRIPTKIEPTP